MPLSLDVFQQQRLVLALLVLQGFAHESAAPSPVPKRVLRATTGVDARPALARRHVRPARGC